MALEIERKFLVKGDFRHLSVREIKITQAYLSVDPSRIIRLRITGERAFLTIKNHMKGTSFTKNEWEVEIPLLMANEILDVCLPGRIIKTRYHVPSGQHMFEVDVFHDKNEGLVVAEIELSDEKEDFEKPAWIGEEVTGRAEFNNSNLIK